jgi:hypothetical protein
VRLRGCLGHRHAEAAHEFLERRTVRACAAGGGKAAVQSVEYCGTPPGEGDSCAAWIRGATTARALSASLASSSRATTV